MGGGGQRIKVASDVIARGGATDPFVVTEIRGVGVARHLLQGSSFSTVADQDRNVWPVHRLWCSQLGVVDLEVLASIAHRGVTPKPGNDFYRFSERLMALSRRRKAHPKLLELPGIVPDTDAEDQASLTQAIDIRRLPGQNDWVAIVNAADQSPKPDSLSSRGKGREHIPGIGGSVRTEPALRRLLIHILHQPAVHTCNRNAPRPQITHPTPTSPT